MTAPRRVPWHGGLCHLHFSISHAVSQFCACPASVPSHLSPARHPVRSVIPRCRLGCWGLWQVAQGAGAGRGFVDCCRAAGPWARPWRWRWRWKGPQRAQLLGLVAPVCPLVGAPTWLRLSAPSSDPCAGWAVLAPGLDGEKCH